jgi:hypothetical protein
MALAKYTLTNGKWKKISAAGENGKAWLKTFSGSTPRIIISHSTAAIALDGSDEVVYASATPLDVDIAYRLPIGTGIISDSLSADSASDIFYATVLGTGNTCEIITDFI